LTTLCLSELRSSTDAGPALALSPKMMNRTVAAISITVSLTLFHAPKIAAQTFGDTAELRVIDPEPYSATPVALWPGAFLVQRTTHLNIFFDPSDGCRPGERNHNLMPDIDAARELEARLVREIEPLISDFVNKVNTDVPSLAPQLRQNFFPLSVLIHLQTSNVCAEGDVYAQMSFYNGPGAPNIIATRVPIITLGTITDQDEQAALKTITMHEVGHLIARAIAMPELYGEYAVANFLEETFADFVASYANGFTPYIGEGMGMRVNAIFHNRLISPNTTNSQKIVAAMNLDASSPAALRDFTIRRSYSDIYTLADPHNVSSVINHLTWRFSKFLPRDILADTFFLTFQMNRWQVMDADVAVFVHAWVKNILARDPSAATHVNDVLHENGFDIAPEIKTIAATSVVSTSTPTKFEVSLDGIDSLRLFVQPTEQLINLNFTIYHNDQVVFWGPQYDGHRFNLTLYSVPSCGASNTSSCVCFGNDDHLDAETIFRGKDGLVTKTPRQKIDMNTVHASGRCFVLRPGVNL
jgi:hypothetical protein